MEIEASKIAENSILIVQKLVEHSFSTYQFVADRIIDIGFPSTEGNGLALILFAISAIVLWSFVGRSRNAFKNMLLIFGGLFIVGVFGYYVLGLRVT